MGIGLIIILVLLFLGFVFLYINGKAKSTNAYSNLCIDIKAFRDRLPQKIQLVNMGSTYSKFAFSSLNDKHLNYADFSLQSESLEMDDAIINHYMDRLESGCVVAVVAAACLLLYREAGENLLYYQILDDKEIPTHSVKKKIKSIFPILKNKRLIKKVFKDDRKWNSIYESQKSNLSEQESMDYLNGLEAAWKNLFHLSDLKSVNLSQENYDNINLNIDYLKKIIGKCKEKSLRPIIVVPPFSRKLNDKFSKEFTDKVVDSYLCQISQELEVPYLNYQYDEYFQIKENLYIDKGFRLNYLGSTMFVNRLFSDLKIYGIDISNKTVGEHDA